jgi:hypothetical protein
MKPSTTQPEKLEVEQMQPLLLDVLVSSSSMETNCAAGMFWRLRIRFMSLSCVEGMAVGRWNVPDHPSATKPLSATQPEKLEVEQRQPLLLEVLVSSSSSEAPNWAAGMFWRLRIRFMGFLLSDGVDGRCAGRHRHTPGWLRLAGDPGVA